MYRCKECNTEYKTKPDYCDCGNDTFDYIEEKKTFTLEQKTEIVSRIFFAICLAVAISVWFIPVKKTQHQTKPKPVATAHTPIPNINKIWDDTPIYQPKVEQPIQITEPIILTPTAPVQKKNIIPAKVVPQTPKKAPVTDVRQKVTEPPKAVQKPPAKSAPVVVKNEPVKVVEQPKRINPPTPVYNPNSPAMIDYKTKLRAALFSKFAVGSIQGSGTCSISFSVDKTGKLINRKFTRESDNKSLNDTVYYMLMSVPKFSAPPAGYNGETIRMNFSINNGNYEISIN